MSDIKLIEGKRIIDYISEQMDIYDLTNLKIEQSIIDQCTKIYDRTGDRILDICDIYGRDMSTTLKYETLCKNIEMALSDMYSQIYKILTPAVDEYYNRGYEQMSDLISIGQEVQEQVNSQIHEMQVNPDAYAVDFIKKHSFERVKNVTDGMINDMRTQLGGLLVSQGYSRDNIMKAVNNTLVASRSRVQMIAQTEMSMAYNAGALKRMYEFNAISGQVMQKYWYGFKYSVETCTYCRPRIGNIYDLGDDREHLPAHPRCRCVWLPFVDGWDSPISMDITRKANMLKRTLSPTEIYGKINKRLGIDYAQYMDENIARQYISGNRSTLVKDELNKARDLKIKDVLSDYDITSISSTEVMKKEYKVQMQFWKQFTAEQIADMNIDMIKKSYEAIKGVMILPWSGEQLNGWNKLLNSLKKYI